MKPKPFSPLNHLTVPIVMGHSSHPGRVRTCEFVGRRRLAAEGAARNFGVRTQTLARQTSSPGAAARLTPMPPADGADGGQFPGGVGGYALPMSFPPSSRAAE